MTASECCPRCGKCGRRKSPSSTPSSSETAASVVTQENRATLLGVDAGFLRHPKIHGHVFDVAYGRNYTGSDQGNIVVVKWVRRDHHCHSEDHLASMRVIHHHAAEIVYRFLREADTRGWNIVLNAPKVWQSDEGKGRTRVVLVEPYIHKFLKFNSNSGWVGDSERTFSKVVQALSHFSYVWSGGRYVLCDLQGGVREEDKTIFITDPAIISLEEGRFGCTDMGKDYMANFFEHHQCSGICRHMAKPKDRKVFFRPVRGTLISRLKL